MFFNKNKTQTSPGNHDQAGTKAVLKETAAGKEAAQTNTDFQAQGAAQGATAQAPPHQQALQQKNKMA